MPNNLPNERLINEPANQAQIMILVNRISRLEDLLKKLLTDKSEVE